MRKTIPSQALTEELLSYRVEVDWFRGANRGNTPWNKGHNRSNDVRAKISAGVRAESNNLVGEIKGSG
jgi:hypothetical protein